MSLDAQETLSPAERNLFFAFLAFQMRLLTPQQLAQACAAWQGDFRLSLAEWLIQREWLKSSEQVRVERLLDTLLGQAPEKPSTHAEPFRVPFSPPPEGKTKNPEDRFFSFRMLAEDYQRFLDEPPVQRSRKTFADPLKRWCCQNPNLVGGAFALLLTAVLVLSFCTLWLSLARLEP